MTPSEYVRPMGLSGLNQMAEMTKQHRQTLHNWYYQKPELFRVVALGCAAAAMMKDSETSTQQDKQDVYK